MRNDVNDGSELQSAIPASDANTEVKGGSSGGDDYFADMITPEKIEHNRQLHDEQQLQNDRKETYDGLQNKNNKNNKNNREENKADIPEEITNDNNSQVPVESIQSDSESTSHEDEGEVIEVNEDEYEYLKGLSADQLIAYGVKHKKQESAMHSKFDKVQKIVGKQFVDQAVKGEIPQEVNILINNLSDETFQQHVADFYNTHTLEDGVYKRTTPTVPTTDILEKHFELAVKRENLNPLSFMPEGSNEDFDYNTAVINPQSSSGRAWRAYETEKNKIDSELQSIREASISASQHKSANQSTQAEIGKKQLETLYSTYPELQADSSTQAEFVQFVNDNRSSALDVFYRAFKATNTVKKQTKRLILKEMRQIENNKQSTTVPAKAPTQKTANISSPDFKQDDDYFGDKLFWE